jgi:hypothetical protein
MGYDATSLHISPNKRLSDLCEFHSTKKVMTAAEHLRAWFTDEPRRKQLISARALDLAGHLFPLPGR